MYYFILFGYCFPALESDSSEMTDNEGTKTSNKVPSWNQIWDVPSSPVVSIHSILNTSEKKNQTADHRRSSSPEFGQVFCSQHIFHLRIS